MAKKKCLFGNVHEEQKEKEMAIHRWDMQIHYPEGLKPAIILMMKLCESNQIYDRFGMKRPNNIPSKKSRIPRIMHINFMI